MEEKDLIALLTNLVGEKSPARLLFYETTHRYGLPLGELVPIPIHSNEGCRERFDISLDPKKVKFSGAIRLESGSDIVSCSLYQHVSDMKYDRDPIVKLVSGATTVSVHSSDQLLFNKLVFAREIIYYGESYTNLLPILIWFMTKAEELMRSYPAERCSYDILLKARALLT